MKQLSVFVENQPGSLMRVTSALAEAQVNIRAVASFDTPEFGILRMIVDDPQAAKEYLTSKGFVVRMHTVIGAELVDEQGNLNEMLKVLAESGVNLNYIYSFVIRGGKSPVMVFNTNEPEKAAEVLKEAKVKIVTEDEI